MDVASTEADSVALAASDILRLLLLHALPDFLLQVEVKQVRRADADARIDSLHWSLA